MRMREWILMGLFGGAVGVGLTSFAFAAPKAASVAIPAELGKQVVTRYTEIVTSAYADALESGRALRKSLDGFVANPTAESLAAARAAWKTARDAYGVTEAFRFYGGPIDDPENGPEGLMNAWPLDESYLDYVKGDAGAGLIQHADKFPKITQELLLSLNEKDGEKNISTGYHAIEFLLWGQDFILGQPGQRTHADYVVKGAATPAASKSAERRGQVLRLLGEILEGHLAAVAKEWAPGKSGNYADRLRKEPLNESLRKIYTGVVNLSIDEMAGERMTVPLEKSDQENEQSCFSDYTVADMISNQRGVLAVYSGRWKDTEGPGLHALGLVVDPALAKKTESQLNAAMAALKKMPQNFDEVIAAKKSAPSRKAAMKTITLLEDQAKWMAKAGLKMGLELNIQE